MLANLQRTTTLILVAAIAGWAAWTIVIGRPELAWIGAAVVAATYAGILGVEFWLLRRSFAPSDPLRPTISQLIRCWIHECAAAPRVFFWRQPFRSRSIVDCPSAPGPRRRGVVLVHGFACNRGLWNPWMRRLQADGIPFVAVNLEPVFGSIDSYSETLERAVRALEQATGEAPVIVAHSMGGLAVRAWLARGQPHRVVDLAGVAVGGGQCRARGQGARIVLAEDPLPLGQVVGQHRQPDQRPPGGEVGHPEVAGDDQGVGVARAVDRQAVGERPLEVRDRVLVPPGREGPHSRGVRRRRSGDLGGAGDLAT